MTKRRFAEARARLQAARLYLILGPRSGDGGDPLHIAAAAVRGGVELVQVRLKRQTTAERIEFTRHLIERLGRPGPVVIVNDDPEAAVRSGADGVHLGRDDPSIEQVRSQVGADLLVGLSTHSLEEALRVEASGADYAGLGAMFPTQTKLSTVLIGPDSLRDLSDRTDLPVFAIGGITLDNLGQITAQGCCRVAVGSAILDAPDPEQAARAFRDRLREPTESTR